MCIFGIFFILDMAFHALENLTALVIIVNWDRL